MTAHTEKLLEKTIAWITTVVITSLLSWATWSTAQTMKHDTRISVVETRTNAIDKSLVELKDGQHEILQELRRGSRRK